MKRDLVSKILLCALLVLLCANLLITLHSEPVHAQQSQPKIYRYRVFEGRVGDPGFVLANSLDNYGSQGYRLKALFPFTVKGSDGKTDTLRLVGVMEKEGSP